MVAGDGQPDIMEFWCNPVIACGRSRLCFSPATTELGAAMRAGRLQHSGGPMVEACVRAKPFTMGNRNPDDVLADVSPVIESA
jgi:hypothetical protein